MYKAHRDSRFEYAGDVIEFIESRQCGTCKFREDDEMCSEIAMGLLLEETIADLDDVGKDGVVCRRHKVEPPPDEPADQYRLF